MDLNLSGKRALVTGSTLGIGRAIADTLLAEGASVIVNSRNEGRVEQAIADMSANGEVSGLAADLSTADGAAAFTHRDEVDQAAVRPVAVGQRHDVHALIDGGKDGCRPVVVLRPWQNLDDATVALRQLAPGIDVRGKLLFQHENSPALTQGQIKSRRGQAVAGRRDDENTVGPGADQLGERPPGGFGAREEIGRRHRPRHRLASQAFFRGGQHGVAQRGEIGAIEIGDIVGNIEKVPLTGDHGIPAACWLQNVAETKPRTASLVNLSGSNPAEK